MATQLAVPFKLHARVAYLPYQSYIHFGGYNKPWKVEVEATICRIYLIIHVTLLSFHGVVVVASGVSLSSGEAWFNSCTSPFYLLFLFFILHAQSLH